MATTFAAQLPTAHVIGTYVGPMQPVLTNELIPATVDAGAAVRVAKKKRRKEILGTKWYCQFCKTYTERGEIVCGKCGVPGAASECFSAAEEQRLASRKSRKKGRELNRVGAGAAACVEREAAGIFDSERRAAAVLMETQALREAIGNPSEIARVSSLLGPPGRLAALCA